MCYAEEFGILYVKLFFSVPITEGWSAEEHKETSTTSLMTQGEYPSLPPRDLIFAAMHRNNLNRL